MTTRTQWVPIVADSHRNRSMLQRLSFVCPRRVNQKVPPEFLCRSVMTGENPANDVFVDLDVERQGDLLCDSRTTCGWRIVISPATGSSPESVSGLGCDSPGRLGLEVKSPGPTLPAPSFLRFLRGNGSTGQFWFEPKSGFRNPKSSSDLRSCLIN